VALFLYIDPFGGAAGDMLLGALLDLGVDLDAVRDAIGVLGLVGCRLEAERDRHQGFAGTRVTVHVEEESHPARRLAGLESLLARAPLPEQTRRRSLAAFRRLFEAEAEAHGVSAHEVHLHELGTAATVVDVVGTCAAIETLAPDRILCGPVPVGGGTVRTAHGLLPVPGPAVARLLTGVPLAAHSAAVEMTTPTGATLVTTLADAFGPFPSGRLLKVGIGVGTRQFVDLPNMLRVFLLEPTE